MDPEIPKQEKDSTSSHCMYKKDMDQNHMTSVAVMNRNTTAPVSLYMGNDITAEAVISELNLFRPSTTPLPLWNGITSSGSTATQGIHYSINSNPSTTNTLPTTASIPCIDSPNHTNGRTAVISSGGSYDVFPNTTREKPPTSLQLSPHTSFSESGNQSPEDSLNSSDQEDCEQPFPKRKKRTPVPNERKDAKYWDRRKKNNDAAKRSRDMRRKKIDDELKTAKDAIQENQKLKQEIDLLKAEINSLRRLLKDANTTLSLWIRARQAAEPNVQLPPMLRGSNVSLVNFPVTTTT